MYIYTIQYTFHLPLNIYVKQPLIQPPHIRRKDNHRISRLCEQSTAVGMVRPPPSSQICVFYHPRYDVFLSFREQSGAIDIMVGCKSIMTCLKVKIQAYAEFLRDVLSFRWIHTEYLRDVLSFRWIQADELIDLIECVKEICEVYKANRSEEVSHILELWHELPWDNLLDEARHHIVIAKESRETGVDFLVKCESLVSEAMKILVSHILELCRELPWDNLLDEARHHIMIAKESRENGVDFLVKCESSVSEAMKILV